jgi:enamine deaminase RidA (YjgF/YER057c/UK114 family)
MQPTPINPWSWSGKLGFDNLESVLAAADMTLANIVRLNVYTTYVDELFRHWASLVHRWGLRWRLGDQRSRRHAVRSATAPRPARGDGG